MFFSWVYVYDASQITSAPPPPPPNDVFFHDVLKEAWKTTIWKDIATCKFMILSFDFQII